LPSQSRPHVRIIVVMGVSGCGKSTVGAALAERYGKPFLDGDDYHPVENVEKMRSGEPLTDADRWPWLAALGMAMREAADSYGQVFTGCSALKRSYRDALRDAATEPILFIHLDGSRDLIAERMATRTGHYMPTGLLDSQIATLEALEDDELAIQINVDQTLDAIHERCMSIIDSTSG